LKQELFHNAVTGLKIYESLRFEIIRTGKRVLCRKKSAVIPVKDFFQSISNNLFFSLIRLARLLLAL
jgi:hypothetical protein